MAKEVEGRKANTKKEWRIGKQVDLRNAKLREGMKARELGKCREKYRE